ncbi:hypothetical protein MYX82_00010 [Acidobacteria bacterium AH-259-D05]|nr:hypothetical protein [Acidobacteria bacterium AH-259-D05]
MDFIDIHTHILPGVDDGAGSIDETLAMLRIAYDSGTRKMVATPHMFMHLFHNNDFVEIRDRFEQFKLDLDSYQDKFPYLREIDLYLGAENYACPEFLEALDQGCVLTLNGSRYLLVEVFPMFPFGQMKAVIEKIFSAGYMPVIAHAERYAAIQEDPLRMEPLWQQGCVVQVNARSVTGASGSRVKKCADKLLGEGLVDVIATDGHRPGWRPPDLQGVFRKLEQKYGQDEVKGWMVGNPGLILANERIVPADHAEIGG